jgi:dihydrofolate reductase
MRKLFLQMNVSLDGYIEDARRELDWHFVDDAFEEYCNNVLRSIDGMLLGRVAYELLAAYWPTADKNPAATQKHLEAVRLMNELPKLVVSNTLEKVTWRNSRILRGNFAEEIARLKRQPGKDLVLFAGAALADSCIKAGLIDEYRLILNPVLLGGGTPLFREGRERTKLKLVEVKPFESGALVLTYRPAERAWL